MKAITLVLSLVLLALFLPLHRAEFTWRDDEPSSSSLSSFAHIFSRFLAAGDFASINEAMTNVTLKVPDPDPITMIVLIFFPLTISLRDIECKQLNITELTSDFTVKDKNQNNKNELLYNIDLFPFSMNCYGNYVYKIFGVESEGSMRIVMANSRVQLGLGFESPDFATVPPNETKVGQCSTNLRIAEIEFSGGIENSIASIFRNQVNSMVSNAADGALCKDASTFFGFLDNLLSKLNVLLRDMMKPVSPDRLDPLQPERNMNSSADGAELIRFQKGAQSGDLGKMLSSLLDQADNLLGDLVDDPDSPNGEKDLAINVWLRDGILDDDGYFVLNLTDSDGKLKLYDQHDKFLDMRVELNSIRVRGLDTLQTFHPIDILGNYTVESVVAWESLSAEVEVVADIQTSSLPDSLFLSSAPVRAVETLTLSIDVSELDIGVALLLAAHQDRLGQVEIGSFLKFDTIASCLGQAMQELDVSGLNVSVGSLGEPSFTGFGSPGVDRLTSSIVDAAYVMYKDLLIKAIPGLFQGPVRDLVNKDYLDPLVEGEEECLSATVTDSHLDFRNMFLPSEEAVELGATGSGQYGSLARTAYSTVVDQLTKAGDDGLPKLNKMIVRPLTKSQSGVEGNVEFSRDGMDFDLVLDSKDPMAGLKSVTVSVSDFALQNLDTINFPITMLEPIELVATLRNIINAGVTDRPLELNFTLGLLFEGSAYPDGVSNNTLAFRISADAIGMLTRLQAWISSAAFTSLPLEHVLNFDCWFATFDAPSDDSTVAALSFVEFTASMLTFDYEIDCIQCSDSGTALIPSLIDTLKAQDESNLLGFRFEDMIKSVMEGEPLTGILHGLIDDGRQHCPSHPSFDPLAKRTAWNSLKFPTLTEIGLDSLLYLSIVGMWQALIVVSETQQSVPTAELLPLSSQESFSPPQNVTLIDWTNLGSTTGLGSVADEVFDMINSFLEISPEDNSTDINSAFRDLLGDDLTLELDLDLEVIDVGDFVLRIAHVELGGLETFRQFTGLVPIAAQTLQLGMDVDRLTVDVDVEVMYKTPDSPRQTMKLRLAANDVKFDVAIFVAMDVDKLGELTIGSMLDSKKLLPCLISAAHATDIPFIDFSLSNILPPEVVGLKDDTSEAANGFLLATFAEYGDTIAAAIPNLVQGPVRSLVAGYMDDLTSGRVCNSLELNVDSNRLLDFRDLLHSPSKAAELGGSGDAPYGDMFAFGWDLLQSLLLETNETTNLAKLNDLIINPITESQSGVPGTWEYPGSLVNEAVTFNILDARIYLNIYDIFVEGLNTVGDPLSLLETPQGEAHTLKNMGTIGVGRQLKVGASVYFRVEGDGSDITNRVRMEMEVDSGTLLLNAVVNVIAERFVRFPLKDMLNFNCLLATLQPPALDSKGTRLEGGDMPYEFLNTTMLSDGIKLDIMCIECGSPAMEQVSELLRTTEGELEGSSFSQGLIDILLDNVWSDFIALELDRRIANARFECPHHQDYKVADAASRGFDNFDPIQRDTSIDFLLALGVSALAIVVVVSGLITALRVIVRRRHRKWLDTIPDNQVLALLTDQKRERQRKMALNETTTSLFLSEEIPNAVRLLIPVTVVGNIGLFLSGHLNIAASVNLLISFAGDEYREDSFFEFSIANGTINLWKAGGYELAILILVFSGIWPYLKQLISLGLWFAPPSRLDAERRGRIYLWLDFLAKWSMVDIFTLLISLVAFRVTVLSPDLDFLPKAFYQIDLMVIPKFGLYANLLAQIVSQVSSHFIIHYQRKVVEAGLARLLQADALSPSDVVPTQEETRDEDDDYLPTSTSSQPRTTNPPSNETVSLAAAAYIRPHRQDGERLKLRSFVAPLLGLHGLAIVALVAVAFASPAFSAEILGLFGIIVESGYSFEQEASRTYSMLDMMQILFQQAEFNGKAGDYIGLGALAALLVSTVLLVPMAQTAVLLYQWFIPLTRERRKQMGVVNEVLQAWQYTEVFALSIVAGSWQLGSISHFMMNIYCEYLDDLKNLLSQLVYFDILDTEDAQCFLVESRVQSGFYLVAAGALLIALLNTFVTKATAQYDDHTDATITITTTDSELDDKIQKQPDNNETKNIRDEITEPTPLLFTDRFRWCLMSESRTIVFSSSNDSAKERGVPLASLDNERLEL